MFDYFYFLRSANYVSNFTILYSDLYLKRQKNDREEEEKEKERRNR